MVRVPDVSEIIFSYGETRWNGYSHERKVTSASIVMKNGNKYTSTNAQWWQDEVNFANKARNDYNFRELKIVGIHVDP